MGNVVLILARASDAVCNSSCLFLLAQYNEGPAGLARMSDSSTDV